MVTDFILFLLFALLTFAGTVLISRKLIPILKSKKMGQKILEIGPRWHKGKEGTPTMGGLAFICASVLTLIAVTVVGAVRGQFADLVPFYCAYLFALLNGGIGIIDDRAKLRHKANEGLTAKQKYLCQFGAAVIYIVLLAVTGNLSTELAIPFTGISVNLSWFYYPVAIFLLTGFVNSVNLTDGIDGLASSVTAVVAIFYAVVALTGRQAGMLPLSAMMLGATLGFLVYNFYPARVFMGDTGSLFLGGLVIGGAFLMGSPLTVILCGIIYVCETASVILQVGYFKLTHGKRLFKMAPIHHHFEQCGWSEIQIVAVFSAVTAVFCVLSWFGI